MIFRDLTDIQENKKKRDKVINLLPLPDKISCKRRRSGNINYIDIPMSFDIESSSYYFDNDGYQAFPQTKKERDKYHKGSCMYIWMTMIDRQFFFGRTWESFIEFTNILKEKYETSLNRRIVIYVHNLSFEFQFMRKYFVFDNVFAMEQRKVCTATTIDGIEFRCSYLLTGKPLYKIGEEIGIHKLKGDLDYRLTRGKYTDLTKEEMNYCFHDVLIVTVYIMKELRKERGLAHIPLTKTGYIRRDVRNHCYNRNYTEYTKLMEQLTITQDEYTMLKRAFQGGFTHANVHHVGKTIENVCSKDFTSSYPAVMLSELFPMSQGKKIKVNTINELKSLERDYCYIFDIKFYGLEEKLTQDNPLSLSKCFSVKNAETNNGRVVRADEIATTITNVDMEYISLFYEWKSYSIGEVYIYKKLPLPRQIMEKVFEYYKGKTELKDVVGMEFDYRILKEFLNSIYGMSVTDPVRDEIIYQNDEWSEQKANKESQLERFNKSKKRFLFYPWGIFITAYARRNLFTGIIALGQDYIYADTDSVKYIYKKEYDEYFNAYNKVITKKIELNFMYYYMQYKVPKTIQGKEKPLGVWDDDGEYSRFKTLGAKRYLAEYKDSGKWNFTVAGIRKDKGVEYLKNHDGFDSFKENMVISEKESGALTHTYIDEETECFLTDYKGYQWEEKSRSGIHLDTTTKSISFSEDFRNYILEITKGENNEDIRD